MAAHVATAHARALDPEGARAHGGSEASELPRGRAAEIQLLHWRREQDFNEVSSQLSENAVLRR